jgi:hypothetical protein
LRKATYHGKYLAAAAAKTKALTVALVELVLSIASVLVET